MDPLTEPVELLKETVVPVKVPEPAAATLPAF
jgi:hypothetical protein